MPARLIAISGPFEGSIYDLPDQECLVGRAADSQVILTDAEISRRHILLRPVEKGLWEVEDLESRNGVFLNGIAVKRHNLKSGDCIRLGRSVFTFDLGASTSDRIRFDETVTMMGAVEITDIPDRDLRLLLNVSSVLKEVRALSSAEDSRQALGTRILEVICGAIPADYAALVLDPEGPGESVIHWAAGKEKTENIPLSRSIVHRVIQEKVNILLSDAGEISSESIAGLQIRNILAAPLTVRAPFEASDEAPISGILYLALTNARIRYSKRHLELLASIAEIASTALENLGYVEWLQTQNRRLVEEARIKHDMVGQSNQMKQLVNTIDRVAPSSATVLILGESGTGKELVARAIHRNSPRVNGPFVAVNCAAIPESLLESELFGHEKGAFTGAIGTKRGKLEMAEGGTIFLDEIGEMSPGLQAKLLRVLQQREFERVGGTKTLRLDIRVIAATNQDLEAGVKSGKFREDLYYRLNVITIRTPPLRERRDDILPLAHHFAVRYGEQCNRTITGFTPRAQRLLLGYSWPGNVRELENAIERAVVMGSGELMLPEDLPENLHDNPMVLSADKGLHAAVQEAKRKIVLDALAQTQNNFVKAAQLLDVHPNYLHRLVNNLGLRRE